MNYEIYLIKIPCSPALCAGMNAGFLMTKSSMIQSLMLMQTIIYITQTLTEIAQKFGDLVKAVVDIEKNNGY